VPDGIKFHIPQQFQEHGIFNNQSANNEKIQLKTHPAGFLLKSPQLELHQRPYYQMML
jgi:hypothetical protein